MEMVRHQASDQNVAFMLLPQFFQAVKRGHAKIVIEFDFWPRVFANFNRSKWRCLLRSPNGQIDYALRVAIAFSW